jgi:hypothetical protein
VRVGTLPQPLGRDRLAAARAKLTRPRRRP